MSRGAADAVPGGDDAVAGPAGVASGAPTEGSLELTDRIMSASNATFLSRLGDTMVVYKPIQGERPLWDFPDGNLAHREVAAYLVSQSFGWNIVPRTWLGDGPLGVGMLQLWQECDPAQDAVELVASRDVPDLGWRQVLDGQDEYDNAVTLIHEDSVALRRMAVFDIVVNNADRKGGHVLAMEDGHRYGVDHGLTFHVEHKLRTVLWGWLGEKLTADELDGLARVRDDLGGGLGDALAGLVTEREIEAFAARIDRLQKVREFPSPRGRMPAVPWPLF